MIFSEYRYAGSIIAELRAKRILAEKHGGDVAYFDRLIKAWQEYKERL